MIKKIILKHHIFFTALAYFTLAAIFTLPLLFRINSYFWGEISRPHPDVCGTIWVHWIVKQAVTTFNLNSLWHTPMIFYPIGQDFLYSIHNILLPLCELPLYLLLGFPAYFNLGNILILTINGVSIYLLVTLLAKSRLTAFFMGIIFVLNPLTIEQLNNGQLDQAASFWMIFYIIFLIKTLDAPSLKNGLLSGVFFCLSSLSYWFYAAFLVFFTCIFLIYHALFLRKKLFNQDFFKGVSALALSALILTLPFAWHFIKGRFNCPLNFGTAFPEPNILKTMDSGHFFNMVAFLSAKIKYPFNCRNYLNILYIINILAIISCLALKPIRKKSVFWILTAVFFYILSLGPYLQLREGERFYFFSPAIYLPYIIFYKFIPFLNRLWHLERFLIITNICLIVSYAFCLDWLLGKVKNKLTGAIIGLVLTSLVVFGGISLKNVFPIKVTRASAPEFYQDLKEKKDGAIIELPIYSTWLKNLYYQTIHQKKTLNGMGMDKLQPCLIPGGMQEFIENNSFLKLLSEMPDPKETGFKPEDKEILKKLGFKYVVVNLEYFKYPSVTQEKNKERINPYQAYQNCNKILEKILGAAEVYPQDISVYNL